MKDLALYFADEIVWFGTWRNTVIQVWGGTPTLTHVERGAACTIAHARRVPEGVVTIALLAATKLPRLGDAERARSIELTKKTASVNRIVVQIIEGTGLVTSVVRGIVAGINMLNPTRTRVFSNSVEAANWLVAKQYVSGSAADIVSALEAARLSWNMTRLSAV